MVGPAGQPVINSKKQLIRQLIPQSNAINSNGNGTQRMSKSVLRRVSCEWIFEFSLSIACNFSGWRFLRQRKTKQEALKSFIFVKGKMLNDLKLGWINVWYGDKNSMLKACVCAFWEYLEWRNVLQCAYDHSRYQSVWYWILFLI